MYEQEGIDDEEEDNELTVEARLEAEREMRRRDRMMGLSQGRMRHGLLYGKEIISRYCINTGIFCAYKNTCALVLHYQTAFSFIYIGTEKRVG